MIEAIYNFATEYGWAAAATVTSGVVLICFYVNKRLGDIKIEAANVRHKERIETLGKEIERNSRALQQHIDECTESHKAIGAKLEQMEKEARYERRKVHQRINEISTPLFEMHGYIKAQQQDIVDCKSQHKG